ncbi:mechanosensitive ion channel family protein [Microbacterium sp. W1N]|uniref:mechanosensitive ion channel family protein n=1 Tax=Microbacterium festucae TaxID=2977531 RepID=UPI0021C0807A|nr:mechanosensitive ion channel family protein [Microbacterium festucae]MCT9819226.1 mechanosensitive ion channel family protein [Microbacterium festucae]
MDLSAILPSDVQWWSLLIAIGIAVAGWVLSRYARKGVRALLTRTPGISETVAHVASRVCGYAVILLGFGIGLAVLGANVQPLLAIVLIVAVVLALVLRGVADNFAAGVLIQTRQPVKVGDEIRVDGPDGLITGTVTELNSRSVVLLTVDGRTVHVPNAMVLGDPIINDSTHGARRSEVQVRVSRGGATVDDLLDQIATATAEVPGVHAREHVRALAVAVSPERLTARVQFWHHPLHGVPVTADVVRALAAALEDAGRVVTVTSEPAAAPLTPPDQV